MLSMSRLQSASINISLATGTYIMRKEPKEGWYETFLHIGRPGWGSLQALPSRDCRRA